MSDRENIEGLYTADCVDLMASMLDKRVDLVVTSQTSSYSRKVHRRGVRPQFHALLQKFRDVQAVGAACFTNAAFNAALRPLNAVIYHFIRPLKGHTFHQALHR
jgi:hypothetical protein